MAKQTREDGFGLYINGQPATLGDVAESSGDERVWKAYLEKYTLRHDPSADRYLRGKLGDYIGAGEVHELAGIKPSTLRKWGAKGHVRTEKFRGRWYYSVDDVLRAINSGLV